MKDTMNIRPDYTSPADSRTLVEGAKGEPYTLLPLTHLPLTHRQAEELNIVLGKDYPDAFIGPAEEGYQLRLKGNVAVYPDVLPKLMQKAGLPQEIIDAQAALQWKASPTAQLVGALRLAEPQPITRETGVRFTKFTVDTPGIGLCESGLSSALRDLSRVRIPEQPLKAQEELFDTHGMPSPDRGMALPERPLYAGRSEKGDIEVIVPGKHERFPAEAVQASLAEAQQRGR